MTLSAFAERRAALTSKHDTLVRRAHQMLNATLAERGHLQQISIDTRSTQDAKQQNSCRAPLLLSIDGTERDGQRDGQTLDH